MTPKYIRPRFLSEVGVAIVVLAALCAAAASIASITAYLHEYGSWCGTVRKQLQACVGLWAPTLSILSLAGWGLASLHKLCPRLCRVGIAITLLVSGVAGVVVGLR